MEFHMFEIHMAPPESYSREIDKKVSRQEMPYGYTSSPPPADTHDYDMRSLRSDKEYAVRGGKIHG